MESPTRFSLSVDAQHHRLLQSTGIAQRQPTDAPDTARRQTEGLLRQADRVVHRQHRVGHSQPARGIRFSAFSLFFSLLTKFIKCPSLHGLFHGGSTDGIFLLFVCLFVLCSSVESVREADRHGGRGMAGAHQLLVLDVQRQRTRSGLPGRTHNGHR